MSTIKIKLTSIEDVRNFVNAVNNHDGDVDLISGRYIVDGKSIMGIFSLDLLKPIELVIHNDGEAAKDLLAAIDGFIVK